MKTIKLKNGFTVKVDESVFHQMRLLDALEESKTDGSEFSTVVRMILGREQREALYEYLEADGKEATVEELGDIINEISTALGDTAKNS